MFWLKLKGESKGSLIGLKIQFPCLTVVSILTRGHITVVTIFISPISDKNSKYIVNIEVF